MSGILWKKAIALSIGASLALIVFVMVSPFDPVWLWNQHRVEQVQLKADLFREEVVASMNRGTSEECYGSYRHSNGFEHLDFELGPAGFYYEASHCTGIAELAYGRIANVDGARIQLEILEHLIVERRPPGNIAGARSD